MGEENWNRRSRIGEGGESAAHGGFVAKQITLPKSGHVAVKGEGFLDVGVPIGPVVVAFEFVVFVGEVEGF